MAMHPAGMQPLGLLAIWTPGMGEMIVLLIIVLILFGPRALPQLGKALGSALREFKGAANKFNEERDREAAREQQAPRNPPPPAKPAPAGTAPAAPPPGHE